MHYRMSVIYGHLVIAATRALRFSDHVTKRNGGSGDENVGCRAHLLVWWEEGAFCVERSAVFPLLPACFYFPLFISVIGACLLGGRGLMAGLSGFTSHRRTWSHKIKRWAVSPYSSDNIFSLP